MSNFYNGKEVLVAGGTGMLGLNVIEQLLPTGAKIRATLHNRKQVIDDKDIEYVWCDLTKREDCYRVVKDIDYVFLCAAVTSGASVIVNNPVAHITPNLLINSQMLEAACFSNVKRFLFVSSSTTYPPSNHPMKEEEMMLGDPHESVYGVGWMKRYTETLCKFYHKRFKMDVAIVRPTNAFGRYDDFNYETSHVLPALVRKALERQDPYEVWGTGNDVRDFIYAEDLARGLILTLENYCVGEAINIASGSSITIKGAVKLILEYADYTNANVVFNSSKPSTFPKRLVDLTKAREILGFKPEYTFEDGLKKMIEWYKSQRGI